MSKSERYRNEWKYLIDTAQKELICRRLEPVMTLDKHAKNGGYVTQFAVSLIFRHKKHARFFRTGRA